MWARGRLRFHRAQAGHVDLPGPRLPTGRLDGALYGRRRSGRPRAAPAPPRHRILEPVRARGDAGTRLPEREGERSGDADDPPGELAVHRYRADARRVVASETVL